MELALVLKRAPLDVFTSVPRPSFVFAQLVESHLMFPLLALNATRDPGVCLKPFVHSLLAQADCAATADPSMTQFAPFTRRVDGIRAEAGVRGGLLDGEPWTRMVHLNVGIWHVDHHRIASAQDPQGEGPRSQRVVIWLPCHQRLRPGTPPPS